MQSITIGYFSLNSTINHIVKAFCVLIKHMFSSVQSLSCVRLFATPWIAARQASLSITNSSSSLRLTSIKSVMPSSHLILCHPLLLLSSIFPSITVFSNESVLHIRWSKYWSFSISPSNEYLGLISFRIDRFDLLAVQGTLKRRLEKGSPTSPLKKKKFPTFDCLWFSDIMSISLIIKCWAVLSRSVVSYSLWHYGL